MSIKLTDTQLVMLSAAAQRDDRSLVPAPKLKGAAAQKIAGKLIAAGLVKEIKAKAGAPEKETKVLDAKCRNPSSPPATPSRSDSPARHNRHRNHPEALTGRT
jgi:hypothetical protein